MPNITPWIEFQVAFVDDKEPGTFWFSPEAALALDGVEASSGPIGESAIELYSQPLAVSQPVPGAMGLPPVFVLLGVEMELRGRWSGGSGGVRDVQAEAVVGTEVRQSLGSCVLPLGSTGTSVQGGPADTMGFTEADIASPEIGFRFVASSTNTSFLGNTIHIDSVRMRVHYDPPETDSPRRGRARDTWVRGTFE